MDADCGGAAGSGTSGKVAQVTAARSILSRLEPHLPVREYGTCSGVRVPAPAEPRRLFDRVRPSRSTPEHSPFEGALAGVHREVTRPADDVAVVGGGYGITTVVAARRAASVTVYEPTPARRRAIRTTLELNDVEPDAVTLSPAVVGDIAPAEADEKALDPATVRTIEPGDLPACDVLELDCEGAELSILRGLDRNVLPRVVAVEIHPIKLDGTADQVLPAIRDLDYDVRDRLTHDGVSLDPSAFDALLGGTVPDIDDPTHQAYPPVVVATRT